ncbi:MAG: hypothetical protein ABJA86_13710 [Nocardioidaceae bacterium]
MSLPEARIMRGVDGLAEAAGDASVEFDDAVDGFGAAVVGADMTWLTIGLSARPQRCDLRFR